MLGLACMEAACRPPSPPPAPGPHCRVCFEGADGCVFISPCRCTGTGAFIHKACLRRWQRVALASGNPERAHACGVSKAPYMQCYRLGREHAVRWATKRSMADDGGQRQDGEVDDEGEEGQADGWLGLAGALLSPGGLIKSATLFALALVIPYVVLAYYGIMALTFVDPLDCGRVGSGSAAQEALRRREREAAAAAAVAPGRTVLVASSRIARGCVRLCLYARTRGRSVSSSSAHPVKAHTSPKTSSVFSKSIVLLLEHEAAWGSRGVIVNKVLGPSHLRAAAEGTLVGSSSSPSPCVLLGGPVKPNVVTLLHREAGGGGQVVAPGLFMATTEQEEAEGSHEVARLLRRLRECGGSSNGGGACRAFVGYAGWSAGQLQEEVKRGDWCVF